MDMARGDYQIDALRGSLSEMTTNLSQLHEDKDDDVYQRRCYFALKTIKEATAKDKYSDYEKTTLITLTTAVGTIVGSIEKLQSDDAMENAQGLGDIMADLTQCVALKGYLQRSQRTMVAECIRPICQIVTSILGTCQHLPESHEAQFKRVNSINEGHIMNNLKASAKALTKGMMVRARKLDSLLKCTELDDLKCTWASLKTTFEIRANEVASGDGVSFLQALASYIEKQGNTREKGILIGWYIQVSFFRRYQLFKLALLFYCNKDQEGAGDTVFEAMQKQQNKDRKRKDFKDLLEKPNKTNNFWYAEIMLDEYAKAYADLYNGKSHHGELVRIYSAIYDKCLKVNIQCHEKDKGMLNMNPAKYLTMGHDSQGHNNTKFMTFEKDSTDGTKIFSLHAAGYVGRKWIFEDTHSDSRFGTEHYFKNKRTGEYMNFDESCNIVNYSAHLTAWKIIADGDDKDFYSWKIMKIPCLVFRKVFSHIPLG